MVEERHVYALVVDKEGPRLKESGPGTRRIERQVEGSLEGTHYDTARLANRLAGELDQRVVDLTGLKGFYDLKLEWTPDNGTATGSAGPSLLSRANGAFSTRPATTAGQAASDAAPKNFRHGMLAQTVVLASESRARFEELVDALIAEHRPSTKTERALIDNMAVARWRQMRTWSIQKNDLDREIAMHQSTVTTPATAAVAAAIAYRNLNDSGNTLSNAIRHEITFERQFNRSLRDLKFLKSTSENTAESFGVPTSNVSTWESGTETFDNQISEPEDLQFDPSPANEHSS